MIKSERVSVKDIKAGDLILHWDMTVEVEEVEENSAGRIFYTSAQRKFFRRLEDSMIRFTEEKNAVVVRIKKLEGAEDLPLPKYETPKSAGQDLRSNENDFLLNPGEIKLVSTGISFALPDGFAALVMPRSGMALKGIGVANSPGLIDSDYRLEVKIILINHGKEPFKIEKGMRVAQLMVIPFAHIQWEEVEELDETERLGGFGSTGIR